MAYSVTPNVVRTPIGGGLTFVSADFLEAAFAGSTWTTGLDKALAFGATCTTGDIDLSESAGVITIYAEHDGVDGGEVWAIGK